jgi:enoyl-[acyl-carrier protein] reductase I
MDPYLKDKNIVIMGVANERSLAWGVAKSLYKAGANLIFTYRKERSAEKLTKLLSENNFEAKLIVQCDVNDDDSIKEAVMLLLKILVRFLSLRLQGNRNLL